MPGSIQPWIERVWRLFGDGANNRGVFVPSRNALRTIADNESLFGEQITTQRRPSISYNVAFGISRLRLAPSSVGSGSASDATKGKIILSTGTTAGSSYKLPLAEVGVYAPGKDAEIGIGIRPQQAFEGTAFARWGGLSSDGQNGFYFKDEADQKVCAVRRKDDVEENVVPRDQWNLDRLDGSGGEFNKSNININLENGYIWQIDFTWYGYGIIVFGIVRAIPELLEKQRFIPCHVFQVDGDISISEPNLQVFAEINNGDQATDYKLDVGGMQYATLGPDEGARRRKVDEFVEDVTVTADNNYVHLVSFQRKADFLNRSVEILGLDLVASGERTIFEIWIGGAVTGGTWTTPSGYTASETSVEVKTLQAFDETNAILVDRYFVDSNKNQQGSPRSPLIDQDLPDGSIVTLTARNNKTQDSTVSLAQIKLSEGW